MTTSLSARAGRTLLCLLLACLGCGYRFTRAESGLAGGVRWVFAPMMVNHTTEPGAEMYFTQALRTELQRAGVEAAGSTSAQAEIRGEIVSLSDSAGILTNCGPLASYKLFATARLRLVQQERVLNDVTVTGVEEFLPAGIPTCGPGGRELQPQAPADPVLNTERNREIALRHLAEVLMRDAYTRLSSGF